MDIRTIIAKILTIVDYSGDRDAFAAKFVDLCYRDALAEAIIELEDTKESEVVKKINETGGDVEKIKAIVMAEIPQDRIDEHLLWSLRRNLEGALKTIVSMLTDEKKKELSDYVSSLNTGQ